MKKMRRSVTNNYNNIIFTDVSIASFVYAQNLRPFWRTTSNLLILVFVCLSHIFFLKPLRLSFSHLNHV